MRRIRGLYVITDKNLIKRERFVETVEAALRGGADVIQLREKETPREEIVELGMKLLGITRRYGVPLIINDDPYIAKEIGADGVHLGRKDMPLREARKILGEDSIIGASAYGDIELAKELEEEGASYIAFGNFFRSPTKPEEKIVPLEILKEAKKIIKVPIVAIGGIRESNLPLLQYSPDAIAVVSAVFGAEDVEGATRKIKKMFNRRFLNEDPDKIPRDR
jgi:thiamine-phosphate pyrophosphorylase